MGTIVVQETDPDILDVLYAALELKGFRVYALPNIDANFLQIIDQARPHVVILDYRLSGEECIQLSKVPGLCSGSQMRAGRMPCG